jgi:hypothetical protein
MKKSKSDINHAMPQESLSKNGKMFLHLVYEYRCLASAGYAYKTLGDSPNKPIGAIGAVLPEADRIIQDSIHLHSRLLVDFFTLRKDDRHKDDFNIEDFGCNLIERKDLKMIKKCIEIYSLHLTVNRNTVIDDMKVKYPRPNNWFSYNIEIVNKMLDLLAETSSKMTNYVYQSAFRRLYEASEKRLEQGKLYDWPKELEDNPVVMGKYLYSIECSK